MSADGERLIETVTLSQAKALVSCAAHEQSFLILSPPGVGKSDVVAQAAAAAGLPCKSLLGTQIAPEDVTGVPYIVGERSVFCPPRVLLPETDEPFCLFLDELPACTPDIQKAFYSLLLERRLGEHALPAGTWVVAAGNRTEDRALVRTISSALVNRVVILQVRVDVDEWLAWAERNQVRREITAFIRDDRNALLRGVPDVPAPFSTPRAWASLSRALDMAESAGVLDGDIVAALVHGRVSPDDAVRFCAWWSMTRAGTEDLYRQGLSRILAMSIHDLQLSIRATNHLESEGITTVAQLVVKTPRDIQAACRGDAMRLQEIEEALHKHGLILGMRL
ncbi:MAG: DNA-directed RNA polymerase subunit alpha C-terminal domain-containing protein [Pirellulaceae bacterium]|nr:DNA-directed RNA polymerase subunit alpha C-terminal domain-containing protein [Pirellulaceae bacterium]